MRLEYNFSNQHLEMIEAGADFTDNNFTPIPHDSSGLMGEQTGDYIRMSVFNEEGSFIRSFYSNLSVDDVEVIYTSTGGRPTADTVVIANPKGTDIGLNAYPIYAVDTDSLNQYCIQMYEEGFGAGYSSHTPADPATNPYYVYQTNAALIYELFELYGAEIISGVSCSGGDDNDSGCITEQTCEATFTGIYSDPAGICDVLANTLYENNIIGHGDLQEFLDNGNSMWTLQLQPPALVADSVECIASGEFTTYDLDWTAIPPPQLRIYKDASDPPNFYVKPNEALELGNIDEGNYQLQFDFLHNPYYVLGDVSDDNQKYYFYIIEVSPSRKEVRLVTRNAANARVPIVDAATGEMPPQETWAQRIKDVLDSHNFNFVLVISNARNIPITNYKIDKISDPVNPSLILKLYSPLPTDVARLANITIEQEIFTTQIEDIWYKTEAYIEPVDGFGLGYHGGGFLGIDDGI